MYFRWESFEADLNDTLNNRFSSILDVSQVGDLEEEILQIASRPGVSMRPTEQHVVPGVLVAEVVSQPLQHLISGVIKIIVVTTISHHAAE
jgi:hypothetical protein